MTPLFLPTTESWFLDPFCQQIAPNNQGNGLALEIAGAVCNSYDLHSWQWNMFLYTLGLRICCHHLALLKPYKQASRTSAWHSLSSSGDIHALFLLRVPATSQIWRRVDDIFRLKSLRFELLSWMCLWHGICEHTSPFYCIRGLVCLSLLFNDSIGLLS